MKYGLQGKQEKEKLIQKYLLVAAMCGIAATSFFTYINWREYIGYQSIPSENLIPNQLQIIDQPMPRSTSEVAYKKPGINAELPAAIWVPQTFNNCGSAATSMILQYFGYSVGQNETKAALRTNPKDSNVFISEISHYLQTDYNLESKVLFNGDLETLKTLVANDIYVLVETWLHPYEDIGHFAIIRGFDDERQVLIADDSFIAVGTEYPYEVFDAGQWKPFNRTFMPIYTVDQSSLVKSIIGDDWNEFAQDQRAIVRNQKDVELNQADMYAWFNLGKSYFALGEYQKSAEAFERSRQIGWPNRMLWYHLEPVQVQNQLENYQQALFLADLGLINNHTFAELHHEKAVAYLGLGNTSLAIEELNTAIEFGGLERSLELKQEIE